MKKMMIAFLLVCAAALVLADTVPIEDVKGAISRDMIGYLENPNNADVDLDTLQAMIDAYNQAKAQSQNRVEVSEQIRNRIRHVTQNVNCPDDVHQCPDGTNVTRSGPGCVIDCPPQDGVQAPGDDVSQGGSGQGPSGDVSQGGSGQGQGDQEEQYQAMIGNTTGLGEDWIELTDPTTTRTFQASQEDEQYQGIVDSLAQLQVGQMVRVKYDEQGQLKEAAPTPVE